MTFAAAALRVGPVLGLALHLACASAPQARTRDVEAGSLEVESQPVRQSLYRLVYDGGEGRTSLKVVLREGAGERYQLVISDVAGRRVWALDYSPEGVVLIDHREASYCLGGPEIELPEVHPQELPLAAIPRILAGRLPVARSSVEADGTFADAEGRRFTSVVERERLASWSLLDDEGPALWWKRDRQGGILSRRGGEQYRWTLIVTEDSTAPLAGMIPDGFTEGVCGD